MKDYIELSKAVYVGICIYNEIMPKKLLLDEKCVSTDDKKILSLYIGLMTTDNKVSRILGLKSVDIHYALLEDRKYIDLYDKEFYVMFKNIGFMSTIEYYNYLINTCIVKKFNTLEYFSIIGQKEGVNKVLIKK